jgi:hypothetical protein
MHFSTWKPSAPGSTATGCTPLDSTRGDRNCGLLTCIARSPTEDFQTPRHTRLFPAQLINIKNTDTRLNMPTNLGGYTIFWNLTPYSMVEMWQRFRRTCCFLFYYKERSNMLLRNTCNNRTRLHGVTSQKVIVFVINTEITSNLILIEILREQDTGTSRTGGRQDKYLVMANRV